MSSTPYEVKYSSTTEAGTGSVTFRNGRVILAWQDAKHPIPSGFPGEGAFYSTFAPMQTMGMSAAAIDEMIEMLNGIKMVADLG